MDGLRFEIELDYAPFLRGLDAFARREVPFALALSLTMTAQDAQAEVRKGLGQRFNLTSRHVDRGIRIRPANKRSLEAAVGSLDAFMIKQETGGTFRPVASSFKAVPSQRVPRTGKGRIGKARRPRAIIESGKAFVGRTRGGTPAILRRSGRGKAERVEVWYVLARQVKLRPRLGLEDTMAAVATRNWSRNFGRALARAIATRR